MTRKDLGGRVEGWKDGYPIFRLPIFHSSVFYVFEIAYSAFLITSCLKSYKEHVSPSNAPGWIYVKAR